MKELTLERAKLLLAALEAEVAFGCGLTMKEEAYLQALRSHIHLVTMPAVKAPVFSCGMEASRINSLWITALKQAGTTVEWPVGGPTK